MTALRLMALIWAACLVLAPLSFGSAQEATEPLVEVELAETEVVPGQPVVLRITVLVPTWLPKPVSFPTFEVPDLMVKLPERATSPTSKTIDGETWSGVSRGYRISPMVPGEIMIPEQELTITWAEPGKPDPLVTKTTIAPLSLTGVVPEGAEDLDPFIAATEIKLTETLSSDERTLKPGDSLTREIVLEITGTSPLFVPQLLSPHEITGIASYPAEPDVTETTGKTWISGQRTESTTMVAESGGSGSVPAIELKWYNLETKEVETARIEGFELTVDGPVARNRPDIDWRFAVAMLVLGVAVLYALFRFVRWVLPLLRALQEHRKVTREATEHWAYTQVQQAVRRRDYGALMAALQTWRMRLPGGIDIKDDPLQAALSRVGQNLFGSDRGDVSDAWSDLSRSLTDHRSRRLALTVQKGHAGQLAPINPS